MKDKNKLEDEEYLKKLQAGKSVDIKMDWEIAKEFAGMCQDKLDAFRTTIKVNYNLYFHIIYKII
jgi:hypothetical protein